MTTRSNDLSEAEGVGEKQKAVRDNGTDFSWERDNKAPFSRERSR